MILEVTKLDDGLTDFDFFIVIVVKNDDVTTARNFKQDRAERSNTSHANSRTIIKKAVPIKVEINARN